MRQQEEAVYKRRREEVLVYAASLVQSPLVLFRQVCHSWGHDALTATIQDPANSQHFLVIGKFRRFPGWDYSSTPVDNWNALTASVEQWVQRMNEEAKTVSIPEERPPTARPTFEEGPSWIVWIPENGAFSNPYPDSALRSPTPVAPAAALALYYDLRDRAALELQLRQALEEEKRAKAQLQKAQERLVDVQGVITELKQELGTD